MTTEQLEKKYDLRLGQYILDWDLTSFYAERASYFTLPRNFWNEVSRDPDLNFYFIDLYKDFLDWNEIDYSKWGKDFQFINTFLERINWNKFAKYFVGSNNEEKIREYAEYINWEDVKWKGTISKNFLIEFRNKIKNGNRSYT